MDAVRFDAHTHPINGDCEGVHLVTFQKAMDIIKSYTGSSRAVFADTRRMIAQVDLPSYRKYDSLNSQGAWHPYTFKYINMPSIWVTFLHLSNLPP